MPYLDGSLWGVFEAGFGAQIRQSLMAPTTAQAFEIVKAAMQADLGYAWSWHCNLAMAIYDESRPQCYCESKGQPFTGHYPDCAIVRAHDAGGHEPLNHAFCNNAAARFMKLCFDVDTSQPPQTELSRAQKSIVVSNADGSESTGTRGEWVTGHYEVTHERPNRSEHWIVDSQGVRHLVYGDSVRSATDIAVAE